MRNASDEYDEVCLLLTPVQLFIIRMFMHLWKIRVRKNIEDANGMQI